MGCESAVKRCLGKRRLALKAAGGEKGSTNPEKTMKNTPKEKKTKATKPKRTHQSIRKLSGGKSSSGELKKRQGGMSWNLPSGKKSNGNSSSGEIKKRKGNMSWNLPNTN